MDVETLMRSIDWRATAVGPAESWPPSLRALIATMLRARQPMLLFWGLDLVQFYNDAFAPSFGEGRHPSALGQRGEDCWTDAWPVIGAELRGVIDRGEATYHDDALVPIFRNGRMEEVYWTYGYSPAIDADGAVAGVLVVVTETTARVVALRRMQVASRLADRTARSAYLDDLARDAVETLAAAPEDATFLLAYRRDAATGKATVIACHGLDGAQAADVIAAIPDDAREPVDVAHLALPGGRWPEPTRRAISIAIPREDGAPTRLAIGLSPRLAFDAAYEAHVASIERQLAGAAQRIHSQSARIAAEGARNDLLLQAPFAAALIVGPDWRFELANRLYVRMVGREVVGREWRDAFPELIGSPVEAILRRASGGEAVSTSEQRVPLARESDGAIEERFFDYNVVPVRSAAGGIEGMLVVAVEITVQVAARRELERTAERLEAASRTKDEFLAMMGHELRNPLAPIVMALALMRERGDASREQAVIERQVTHMTRLVDDLLDISRVMRGKVELRRAVSQVAALVAHAVEVVAGLIAQRGHALAVEVDPDLWWDGDPTRFEQILSNLLTNAARYTPSGGKVRVSAVRDGDTLVVRVADNGRGIEPSLLPQIFEPFVQGARGTDRREGGLGLGLAVVRGLAALHGGTAEVHSEGAGTGAELVVRLPGIVERAAAAIEADAVSREVAPARLLLVDDNEDAASLTAELFRLAGYTVWVAHDGPAAIELAAAIDPQIAVLDIGLPGMDGYELVRHLRARAGASPCRYFALTGYGQRADIDRAEVAGFDRLLVKPIASDELLRAVRDA